jgi:parallel beta-helix repeat protein
MTNNNNNGITLYISSYNTISHNTMTNNNNNGISLYSSINNMMSANTITDNNNGIYLALYSMNNIIYCNNFNNIDQVWSDSTNVWDYGNQGNYWSDYAEQDLNEDGIGDEPYVIDIYNQDNYPLKGTFSDFNVTLESETYHVTTICNSTISEFRFEMEPETGNKIIRFNVTGKDSTIGFCRVTIPIDLMNCPNIVLADLKEIVSTLLDVSNETHACLYFTYVHSRHTIRIIFSLARKLQTDLYNLNTTYYEHLNNYNILLDNYSQLQKSYLEFNKSYQEHLSNYSKNVHNVRNLTYIFAATIAIFIITVIYLSKRAHVKAYE